MRLTEERLPRDFFFFNECEKELRTNIREHLYMQGNEKDGELAMSGEVKRGTCLHASVYCGWRRKGKSRVS
jgi:hypothetical protein